MGLAMKAIASFCFFLFFAFDTLADSEPFMRGQLEIVHKQTESFFELSVQAERGVLLLDGEELTPVSVNAFTELVNYRVRRRLSSDPGQFRNLGTPKGLILKNSDGVTEISFEISVSNQNIQFLGDGTDHRIEEGYDSLPGNDIPVSSTLFQAFEGRGDLNDKQRDSADIKRNQEAFRELEREVKRLKGL